MTMHLDLTARVIEDAGAAKASAQQLCRGIDSERPDAAGVKKPQD